MQKRYMVIIGLLGMGLAAYAWWWFDKADSVENRIRNQVVDALPSNMQVTFDVGPVTGFPFRFVASLQDFTLTIGEEDTFKTASLDAVVQPGNSQHMILRFAEPIAFQVDGLGEGTVTAERLLASLTMPNDWNAQIDFDAKALVVEMAEGQQFGADRAGIHMRDRTFANDHAYQFSITGAGMHDLAAPDKTARLIIEGGMRHEDIDTGGVGRIGYAPRRMVESIVTRMLFETESMTVNQTYRADFTDLSVPTLTVHMDVTPESATPAMREADVMNSAALADLLEKFGVESGSVTTLDVTYDVNGLLVNGVVLPEDETAAFFDLF